MLGTIPERYRCPFRGRSSPAVCKSISVFNVSGKDNAARHPRRLSIPTKPSSTPLPQPIGSVTPISETRAKRLNMQGKNDTPSSEASKSIIRRKFSVLSSASYWLTQIKLSESASKHSTSLGFFKLALESECEVSRKHFFCCLRCIFFLPLLICIA